MTIFNINILSGILKQPISIRYSSNRYDDQSYKDNESPSYDEAYTPPVEEGINQQDPAFDSHLTKICNIF